MRRFVTFFLVLFGVVSLLFSVPLFAAADGMSKADREHLVQELEETRDALLKEVRGLSREQSFWQPAEDRWAAIHTLEHIVRSERVFQEAVKSILAQEPAVAANPAADADVTRFVLNRSQRVEAPQRVRPTGEYKTIEEGIEEFLEVRRQTLDWVRTTERNIRSYSAANPAIGKDLDGFQWMIFLAGHSARHTDQIREIKAAPGFPPR